jgi:hypothetical protein
MVQTDVSLVIGGKYNADAAIRAAEDGLKRLLSVQDGTANSGKGLNQQFADLSSVLASVDKSYTSLSNTFTAASTKTSQTEANIQSLADKLGQLRQQSEAAGQYVREALSMGPVPSTVQKTVDAAQQAQQRLRTEITRTNADLERQSGAYERQATQLQRLGSYLNAMDSAQKNVTQSIQQTTEAINQQTAAENAAAEAQAATQARAARVQSLGGNGVSRAPSPAEPELAQAYQRPVANPYMVDDARREQEQQNRKAAQAELNEFYREQEQASQAAAAQAEREAAAIQRLRDQINPLAAATRQFNQQKQQLEFMRERLSAEEYASALKMLDTQMEETTRRINGMQGLDSAGRPNFMGLKPYQVQNLGYQINDVLTQLGSGTSLSQTLAQQGGQILQIFDGVAGKVNTVLVTIAKYPGAFAAAAAGAAALAYALDQMYQNSKLMADARGVTAGLGGGANYDPEWIVTEQDAIRKLGVDAKDAQAALQSLMVDGMRSSDISRITEAAADMTKAFGGDFKTAVQDLGKAFNGTTEDMDNFIAKHGALISAQDRQRMSDAEGNGDQAGAQDIFQNSVIRNAHNAANAHDDTRLRQIGSFLTRTRVDVGAWSAGRDPYEANERQSNLERNNNDRRDIAAQRITQDAQDKHNQTLEKLNQLPQQVAEQVVRDRARDAAVHDIQSNPLTAGNVNSDAARYAIQQRQQDAIAEYRQQQEQHQHSQDEQAIRQFTAIVPLLEASGRRGATNPASSASGVGQFTDATWRDVLRRHVPETMGMSDTQLDAQRSNDQVVTRAIAAYTQEIAAALRAAGQQINARNLYAGYHFGPTGGVNLVRNPGAPLDQTIGRQAIQSNTAITHNTDGSQRSGQQLLDELSRRTTQYNGADAGLYRSLQAVEARQQASDRSIDSTVQRALTLGRRSLTDAQAGEPQDGTARLDAEVRQRGTDAVERLREQIEQLNRNIQAQGGRPRQVQQSAFDQIRAYAESAERARQGSQRSDIQWMQPVREGVELQRAMIQRRSDARDTGDIRTDAMIDAQLPQITANILRSIDNAIAHYTSLRNNPAAMQAEGQTNDSIDRNVSQLQGNRRAVRQAGDETKQMSDSMKNAFSDDTVSAARQFFSELREGQGVMTSLKDSFAQFAASFLEQMGEMILKAVMLKAVSMAVGAIGGSGVGSAFSSIMGAAVNHTGGVVGLYGGSTRSISPLVFAGAQRFHTGGFPGLQPDEIPTILQRGEEVITRSDPRHALNGGASGSAGPVNVHVINSVDHTHALRSALATPAGGKVLLNHINNNRSSYKSILG